MNEKLLIDLYRKINSSELQIEIALSYVKEFEQFLKGNNQSVEKADIEIIKNYIRLLIDKKLNTIDRLVAIARYFYLINRNDIYIYFTSILGRSGVIDSIKEKLKKMGGEDIANNLFENLAEPPLGSDFCEVNKFTAEMMERFEKSLSPPVYKKVLAGNHHQIPPQAFSEEKEIFDSFNSWEEYLKDKHRRKVAELQKYCDENKVWYEQVITQPVVDFVKKNQEILSAFKQGNKLYITKIPYNPDEYLKQSDPVLKRYYACHCPLARESILNDHINISPNWCYCSGGFAKFPFEVILGRELEVELLECVLGGSDRCRFAIELP